MASDRSPTYIACEQVNMIWSEQDVSSFDHMWNNGLSLRDIARAFDRDPDEVVLLVIDRARIGRIQARYNGVSGRRMPIENDLLCGGE